MPGGGVRRGRHRPADVGRRVRPRGVARPEERREHGMSFTIPPMDAIRSAGQALPRSAAQVASAGAAYMDSFGAAGAVRGPDSVELEGDGAPGKGGGSGEDLMKEGGDPVRASGQFALSKLVH